MGKVILFAEYEELKNETAKLRTEISMLVVEKDELVFVKCKNIEMTYMLALGSLEYQAFQLECNVLRLKRKTELIQAKLNRQEKADIEEIEERLQMEFAEYQRMLDEKIDSMNAALEWSRAAVLSEEETKELKKLYRQIVKALHPDLHKTQSEAEKRLLFNAMLAYESGDLHGMRIIWEMIGGAVREDDEISGLEQMKNEKKRLRDILNVLKERIAEIKTKYPYTLKEYIKDEETIEKHRLKLTQRISELQEAVEVYQNKIEEMLR